MFVLKNKKIFIGISFFLMALSVLVISVFGFNFSVEFKGGSIYEIEYLEKNIPEISQISSSLEKDFSSLKVSSGDGNIFFVKTEELSEENFSFLKEKLSDFGKYQEINFRTVSPSISKELLSKSIFTFVFVVIFIILFIAYVFRNVSKPVSSFKYGAVATLALLHDILIPTAFFSILGLFFPAYQIDVLFVTAILAILGFSVNDTIVIFDRIRENLRLAVSVEKKKNEEGREIEIEIFPSGEDFEKIVGNSLNQAFRRSLFTSITTFLVLATLFFVGGELTKSFSLVLILGTIIGTYSSIFFASPIIVLLQGKKS